MQEALLTNFKLTFQTSGADAFAGVTSPNNLTDDGFAKIFSDFQQQQVQNNSNATPVSDTKNNAKLDAQSNQPASNKDVLSSDANKKAEDLKRTRHHKPTVAKATTDAHALAGSDGQKTNTEAAPVAVTATPIVAATPDNKTALHPTQTDPQNSGNAVTATLVDQTTPVLTALQGAQTNDAQNVTDVGKDGAAQPLKQAQATHAQSSESSGQVEAAAILAGLLQQAEARKAALADSTNGNTQESAAAASENSAKASLNSDGVAAADAPQIKNGTLSGKSADATDIKQSLANDANNQDAGDGASDANANANAKKNNLADLFQNLQNDAKASQKGAVEQADNKAANFAESQNFADAQRTLSSPTAGSRVNTGAALAASGSPAPAPTGSSGGGSPPSLSAPVKLDAIAANAAPVTSNVPAGIVLPQQAAGNASFASYVRAAKDATQTYASPTEQVAVQAFRSAKSGDSSFTLQLHPADLGQVDVKLEIGKDGLVQATITADNQSTLNFLQKDQSTLERAFQQAGLQTDSNSLNFNLRGDTTPQGQQNGNNNSKTAANWAGANGTSTSDVPAETVYYRAGQGRLDVRV